MQDADASRTGESTSREISPFQGLWAGFAAFVAGKLRKVHSACFPGALCSSQWAESTAIDQVETRRPVYGLLGILELQHEVARAVRKPA